MSKPLTAQIRKAAKIVGKTLTFRDATITDAAFILSLRTDPEKNRFLSAVSSELADQEAWLKRYSLSDDQAYFIIEYQGEAIGTVRLYDPQGESFCWGSWILKNTRPNHAAMESALMVYAYAVDYLGFQCCHFDVRKGNEKVWRFHERFGAVRSGETEMDYLYVIGLTEIDTARLRYRKYLPETPVVAFGIEDE